MQARSANGAPGVGIGAFGHRQRSPVSEDSSTSTPTASISRRIGRHDLTGADFDDVARTQPLGGDLLVATLIRRPARRRAGGSCTASSRRSTRSACNCCSADNAALASSTLLTREASNGEPSRALATAPVARIGVRDPPGWHASRRRNRGQGPRIRRPRCATVQAASSTSPGRRGPDGLPRPPSGWATAAGLRPTGSACQSCPGSGSGSASRSTLSPAAKPGEQTGCGPGVHRYRATADHTGMTSASRAPNSTSTADAPLALAARAAGKACSIRQAPVRSATKTSAPQGGRRCLPQHPIVSRRLWAADISGVVSRATVFPSALAAATTSASASSSRVAERMLGDRNPVRGNAIRRPRGRQPEVGRAAPRQPPLRRTDRGPG